MKETNAFGCTSDGLNEEDLYELVDWMDEVTRLKYEIKNCVIGAYTDCRTLKDLIDYLRDLGDNLSNTIDSIEERKED